MRFFEIAGLALPGCERQPKGLRAVVNTNRRPSLGAVGSRPVKTAFLVSLAVLMVVAGALHFVFPKGYVRIVPAYLPAPLTLVYLSGLAESLGGLGLLFPPTRTLAAWGLILLFIAIFPANVNMAVNHIGFTRAPPPSWLLWARLPLQGVLIAWAYWVR
jgi:uncharacterized membrane protein